MTAFILSFVALPWTVHAQVSGRTWVIDGNTIEVAKARIRLHGIDAPERVQTCLRGIPGTP